MNNDINLAQIESALRLLRQVCSDHESCTSCPLRSYNAEKQPVLNKCVLATKQPDKWILVSDNPNNVYPRLFV